MGPHHRTRPRTRPRARRLATSLAAGLLGASLTASLAACGGDRDPATPQPGEETSGPVEHDLLTVVSRTLGGGTVDEQAVDLTGRGGVEELVAGLESGMPAQVRRAVRRERQRPAVQEVLAGGAALYGAVVWVGCETPDAIVVQRGEAGLEVRAVVKAKGTVQCLAPVTSVAVFTA